VFANGTDIGGNLSVTSSNGSVSLGDISVGGDVQVIASSVGDGVGSSTGFNYGGVLDIDTAGGSISVTAKDIGTLDTVGGDGGAITVYSRTSDSLTIVNALAQGGPINLYADQDLTVSGGINSLNGSPFGANVLVNAGGNVALGGVLAGQGSIDVYAGGNGLGSYNNFGQLNTVGGSINVSGGSGTDVFTFGPTVAFGNTVNVYGNGGAGDQVVVDGSGAAAHSYALSGNWLDIDGNTAIQNGGSLVELLITGSDFGDSLAVNGSWAALGWSAVNFEAGGGSTDTVTGPADPTVWQIGSSYGGYLGDGFVQVNFSGVEKLVGGSASNTYSLLDGGYVDSIDGSAGFDTLDTTGQTAGDLQVDLQAGTATTLAGTIAVNGFEGFSARGAGNDTFKGFNSGAHQFDINTAAGDGYYDGAVQFAGFDNLVGGDGNDTFRFANGASFGGSIDGGGAADTDVLDLGMTFGAQTVDLGTASSSVLGGNFANLESVWGNGMLTLAGADTSNTWNLGGSGSGDVNGFQFGGVDSLQGGDQDDAFVFGFSGFLGGLLDGGAGADALDMVSALSDQVLDLDTATFGGASQFAGIESFYANAANDNTVYGTDNAATWSVTGVLDSQFSDGTVMADLYGFHRLSGGDGGNQFQFAAGSFVEEFNGGAGLDVGDFSTYGEDINIGAAGITSSGGLAGGVDFGGSIEQLVLDPTRTNDASTPFVDFSLAVTGSRQVVVDDGFAPLTISNIDFVYANGLLDTLVGTSGDDSFTFDGFQFSPVNGVTLQGIEQLDALAGNDTLLGAGPAANWVVDGIDTGTLQGMRFNDVQVLVGSIGDDVFEIQGAGQITGGVSGGGAATVDMLRGDTGGAFTEWYTVSGIGTGSFDNGLVTDFAGIGQLEATDPTDLLIGTTGDDLFRLGEYGGWHAGLLDATGTTRLVDLGGFSRFDGGAGNDTFVVHNLPSGPLAIMGGDDADVLDLSAPFAALASGSTFDGGAGSDMLLGDADGFNEYWVFGPDAFVVGHIGSPEVTLTGTENLLAGDDDDLFLMIGGGYLSGVLDGGGGSGTDSITSDYAGAALRTYTITGVGAGIFDNDDQTMFVGIDLLESSHTNDILVGTAGNDLLRIGEYNLWHVGLLDETGTTRLIDATGFDKVRGGDGDDRFVVMTAPFDPVAIQGNDGSDTLEFASFVSLKAGSTFDGGAGIDALKGRDGGLTLYRIFGNDMFETGPEGAAELVLSSTENLTGGSSNDEFTFLAGGVLTGLLDGAGGFDTIRGHVAAGVGRTYVMSGVGAGLIDNGGFQTGFVGMDHIEATRPDDVLIGTAGDDLFRLGEYHGWHAGLLDATGTTRLVDAMGFSNLDGGDGNDAFVVAGALSNAFAIQGGNGNDILDGSDPLGNPAASGNTFDGGAGSDTLLGPSGGFNEYRVTATDAFEIGPMGSPVVTLAGTENLLAGDGNDNIMVLAGAGLSGTLDGGGGAGVDVLRGDFMTLVGEVFTLSSVGTGTLGNGQLTGFAGIEAVEATDGSDVLVGTAGNDRFELGRDFGVQTLVQDETGLTQLIDAAGFGNLDGGDGNDGFVVSGALANTFAIQGGSGNDTLDLADPLAATAMGSSFDGGTGSDTFVGSSSGFQEYRVVGLNMLERGPVGSPDLLMTDTENLLAGDGNDNIMVLAGAGLSGTLDGGGGAGMDVLRGDFMTLVGEVFTLSGVGTGTLDNGLATGFAGIEAVEATDSSDVLVGTSGNDRFEMGRDFGVQTLVLDEAGVTQLIDAAGFGNLDGGDGNDRFVVAGTLANTFAVQGGNGDDILDGTDPLGNPAASGNTFDGGAGNDTLLGPSGGFNEYRVTATDAFEIGPMGSPVVTLASTENLLAGDGNDNIMVLAGAGLSGTLDGGGGAGVDVLRGDFMTLVSEVFTLSGVGTGTLGNGQLTGFAGIEAVEATDSSDVLVGTAGNDRFELGRDFGLQTLVQDETGLTQLIDAAGFGSLDGGDGNDGFVVSGALANTFAIQGGSGDDTLDLSSLFASIPAGSSFDGGADTDMLFGNIGFSGYWVAGPNAVDAGSGGFAQVAATNVEAIDGGLVLTGSATGDVWTLDDSGSSVAGIAFANIANAQAGNGTNTFNIGNYTGNAVGGGGTDTFNLSGLLDGNAYGGAGDDIFVLLGGSLTGVLDGGFGPETDLLVGTGGDDLFELSGWGEGKANGNGFTGIESLQGNGAVTTDTLAGTAVGDFWSISGIDSGDVQGVAFSGIGALQGGSGGDFFQIGAGAGASSGIAGGAGHDVVTNIGVAAWTLTGVAGGAQHDNGVVTSLSGVEQLDANGMGDTLVGTSGNDEFVLGNVGNAQAAGLLDLFGFEDIDGGDGDDTFRVVGNYGNAQLAGSDGDDTLHFDGGSFAVATFDGGNTGETAGDLVRGSDALGEGFTVAGPNAVTLLGANASSIERLDGGSDGFNSLTGSVTGDAWLLADTGSSVAGMAFTRMDAIYAGNGMNTFDIGDYTGNVTGGTGTDVFTLLGTLSGNIDGNAGSDMLVGTTGADSISVNTAADGGNINGAGFTGIEIIDGNAGSDTVTGANVATSWNIGGLDSIGVGALSFAAVENLTGGSAADTFFVGPTGRLSGILSGGAGSDELLGSAANETFEVAVIVGGTMSGSLTNGAGATAFSLLEVLSGNGGTDTLLRSGAQADTLVLNGGGNGSIVGMPFFGMTDIDTGDGNDLVSLAAGTHTGNILAGAGDDTFTFDGGSVTGTLDGGSTGETLGDRIQGTTGNDTAVVSGPNAGTFNTVAFAGIERIDAQAGSDTLSSTGASTWNLGGGSDQISGIAYTNFETISAGAGADTFNINGVVNYALYGNGGNDIFNFNAGGQLNASAFGGDGDDAFNLLGGTLGGTLDGGTTGEVAGDIVTGTSGNDTFNVTGGQSGTVNTLAFTGMNRLAGADGDDTFTITGSGAISSVDGGAGSNDLLNYLSASSVTVNGSTITRLIATGWSGFENLNVTTSGASSNITMDGALALAGDVNLSSSGLITTVGGAGSRVGADTVIAAATGGIDLWTDATALDIASAGGNVSVDEVDDLGAVDLAGINVSLVAGGAVTDGDASLDVQGSSSVSIEAASGDIGSLAASLAVQAPQVALTTGSGDQYVLFSGNVDGLNVDAGAGTAVLRTLLAAQTVNQAVTDQVNAGALVLMNGNYVLDGTNNVDRLAANAGSVLLDNGSNALTVDTIGLVSGISSGGALVGLSAGTLAIDAAISTGGGTLLLDADGDINQSASLTAGALRVTSSGGNALLADAGNDVDTLAANVAGNLRYADADGFDIGSVAGTNGISSGGWTHLGAGGNVTDSQALQVNGLALSGSGGYALDAAGNAFTTLAADATGGLLLAQGGALSVGTVDGVAGVNAGAAAVDLTSTGGTLTIADAVGGGTVDITVSDASAINATAAITSGGGVAVATGGAMALADVSAATGVTLSAGTTLTGTGTISGTLLQATAGGNIQLDTDVATLRAQSSGGGVAVSDAGALLIDLVSASGGVDIDSLLDLTVQEVTGSTVSLASGGSILDDNGNAANVTASTASLLAGGSIGSISDFAATSGDAFDVTGLAAGGLYAQTAGGDAFVRVIGNYVTGSDDIQNADTFLLSASGNLDASSGLAAFAGSSNMGLGAGGTLTLPATVTAGAGGATLLLGGNDVVATGGVRSIGVGVDNLLIDSGNAGGALTLTDAGGGVATLDVNLAANGLNVLFGSSGIDSLLATVAGDVVIDVDAATTITDITTANGSVDILVHNGDATVLNVNTAATDDGSNDISVQTLAGSIVVGTIDAGAQNDVELLSAGTILDVANTVRARRLFARADGDIGASTDYLNTNIAQLDAASANGSIWIEEANNITVEQLSAPNGGVVLQTPGNASFTSVVAGASGMTVVVGGTTSLGDIDTSGGGDVDVTSGGNVTSSGNITADELLVDGGGNVVLGGSGSNIDVGLLLVDTTGNVTLDNVTTGNGGVDVTSGGGSVTLVDVVTGAAGDVQVDAGGNVSVTGDVRTGELFVTADGGAQLATGGGSIQADLVDVLVGGNLLLDNIDAGAGGLLADAGGTANIGDVDSQGDVEVNVTGSVAISGVISTAGGSGDIDVTSTAGGIFMEVNGAGDPAGIAEADGAAITLTARDDVVISLIDAGDGTVEITSRDGKVIVNEDKVQSNDVPDIIAGDTTINAGAGIGDVGGKQIVIDTERLNLSSDGPVVEPILINLDTVLLTDANLIPPLSEILGNLNFDPELAGLAYLDPAVFTAVSNFTQDEEALELPEDQKVAATVPRSAPEAPALAAEPAGALERVVGFLRSLFAPVLAWVDGEEALPLAMN
jgi:hypothetical protein